MPVLVRRRPSLDGLRKAAKAAGGTSNFNADTFTYEDSDSQRSDSEMDLPRSKLAHLPSRQKARKHIVLTTSSPVLHQRYQSDEEQPSPTPDDADDASDSLTYGSISDDEYSLDSEEEFDFDEDFDTPLAPLMVHDAPIKAVAMVIHDAGRPNVINVSTIAPRAKREVPISRPESASFATLRRFKAPSPTTVRTSYYEPPQPMPARNYSTPMQRADSCPAQSFSGTSPSSSIPSLDGSQNNELDEAELLIRESDEIQVRSRILAGTEWDLSLEEQSPTEYQDYGCPFGLVAPAIPASPKKSVYNEPETPGKKAWSRFGFKSKFMATSRKASKV